MQYSTNFNLNKPERADQYNLDHWNGNTDIIDTELNALQNITNSTFKTALLNFCYPVGSLYWSSKSTNPGTLFGGTWAQIKDRFVLACGDTYNTTGATGGASTVTLSVSNMPSHNHTFTPVGNVSSHSHGMPNHNHTFTPSGTITMNSHSHGLNNHTHSFSGRTGTMSGNSRGSFNARRSDALNAQNTIDCSGNVTRNDLFTAFKSSSGEFSKGGVNYYINVEHNHSFSGTTDGNLGNTTSTTSTGSFSGTQGTTSSNGSGNTASSTPTFIGVQGTTSSNGSGTSFGIMPPYIVKYCWERTA